jgi:aspartate racemase
MQTIGIIGGLGPEATIEYYKRIIESFKNKNPSGSLNYPEILIYSINMGQLIGHMQKKEFDLAIRYLTYCIQKLKEAGADFAAMTANTPHQFFNEIHAKNCLPLISIVEATREKAEQMGIGRVGLIGTKFTMEATFYKDVFDKSKIEVFVPNAEEIEIINNKLFTELELGIFKDETREQLLDIISRLIDRHNINALILGCTEFPLLFDKESYLDIHFLNTLQIHVDKIVETCLAAD